MSEWNQVFTLSIFKNFCDEGMFFNIWYWSQENIKEAEVNSLLANVNLPKMPCKTLESNYKGGLNPQILKHTTNCKY